MQNLSESRVNSEIKQLVDQYLVVPDNQILEELRNDFNLDCTHFTDVLYNFTDSLVNAAIAQLEAKYAITSMSSQFNVDFRYIVDDIYDHVHRILSEYYPDRYKAEIIDFYRKGV